MPKLTWLLWCPNHRSGDIASTFPGRSSSVATRKGSIARVRRYLLISVILVTIASLLVWRVWGHQEATAVATLVGVALAALTALALPKNGARSEDGELDPGGGQLIAGMLALVGAVAVFAVVVSLIIYRNLSPVPTPEPTPTPTPTPTRTPKPTKTSKPTATPSPTLVTEPSTPPTSKPPPPPPTQSWVTAWKGPFRLRLLSGIDVDTAPPSLATGPAGNLDQGDLFYDNSDALSAKLVPYAAFAIPEPNSRPDAKVCAEALVTLRNNDSFEPLPGQYLCVGTASGRLARLEVTDVQQYDHVRFNVVIWEWRN